MVTARQIIYSYLIRVLGKYLSFFLNWSQRFIGNNRSWGLFRRTSNCFDGTICCSKLSTIFAKSSIIDILESPKYASGRNVRTFFKGNTKDNIFRSTRAIWEVCLSSKKYIRTTSFKLFRSESLYGRFSKTLLLQLHFLDDLFFYALLIYVA